MKAICVIPIRGGSTSVPKKNIKLMKGRPLFTWVFYAALHSGIFEQVWISTDSEEFAHIARVHGARVWLRKDPSVSTNEASSADMMAEFIKGITQESDCCEFDVVYMIHATSPLSKPEHFVESWELFKEYNADALVTTVLQHFFEWEITSTPETSPLHSVPIGNRPRRQDWSGQLCESGDFYAAKKELFIKKDWRGHKIVQYQLPLIHQYDIDEPEDWEIMENLVSLHGYIPDILKPNLEYVLENNRLLKFLVDLNIVNLDTLVIFYGTVRDRMDVPVLRCEKSGVIILSTMKHYNDDNYSNTGLNYWNAQTRHEALQKCIDDDVRRAEQFGSLIDGKDWLDVGTGLGGIADLLRDKAQSVCLADLNEEMCQMLRTLDYEAYTKVQSIESSSRFDIISLFHVFEHIYEVEEHLKEYYRLLKPGGTLLIEVPHARDILLTFLDCEPFKKFTLWSQHLILHTKESLNAVLSNSGFTDIEISGYQRYPYHNHFHWLRHSRPSGFHQWKMITSPELDTEYLRVLQRENLTDTLIATCKKPN